MMPSDVLMNRHMAKLDMAPQSVSWSDCSLTIHEVSQFFSVPIAEAAQKLSVCGSVLQRICKENGIARWPYRKVTAGKSVEDIIAEGLKELATNPSAYKIAEKQSPPTPENTSGSPTAALASTPISGPPVGPDAGMNVGQQPSPKRPLRQQEASITVQPSQVHKSTTQRAQGNITLPQRANNQQQQSTINSSVSLTPPKQQQKPAATPDDFRTGFPSKGLRRASSRWWGSLDSATTTAEPARDGDGDTCKESGLDCISKVGLPTASSLLVRTRRKASFRAQGSAAHAVARGYGLSKLGAKDAATLKFVFGGFLPKHWTSAFPPVS